MKPIQFQVEIINVTTPSFVKTQKGGYNVVEVAYKKDGKVEGKKILDFAAPSVYKAVVQLKPGEVIWVTSEKSDNGFWNWTAVSTGQAEGPSDGNTEEDVGEIQPDKPTKAAVGRKPGPVARVSGNTYETAEERALRRAFEEKKHRQIGRQGCINSAIAILTSGDDTTTSVAAVLSVAKELEAFVFAVGEDQCPI